MKLKRRSLKSQTFSPVNYDRQEGMQRIESTGEVLRRAGVGPEGRAFDKGLRDNGGDNKIINGCSKVLKFKSTTRNGRQGEKGRVPWEDLMNDISTLHHNPPTT